MQITIYKIAHFGCGLAIIIVKYLYAIKITKKRLKLKQQQTNKLTKNLT